MATCRLCGNAHAGSCPVAAPVAQAEPELVMPPGDLHSGRVLQERYELLHVLGQGGMGTVYMANDMRLKGRSCVVKKLRDDFYREEDRQKAQEFFEREMQMLSELRHPNIVQILDFFAEAGDYFLVMEYVAGSNLYALLQVERQGQPFPERTVIDWVQQICEVLHYLHTQHPPVVYRDLKPSNVMLDLNNTIKLVDFGIARPWEEAGEHTQVISAGYSPPEQYWGGLDPRSDIYSLGATMYFLLSGKDPEALHVCSPRAVNGNVSPGVDNIVQQAMAQNFNDRFQSIEEFMEALMHHDYVAAPSTPRSYIGEIVTGVVILTLAAIIFLVEPLLQADPSAGQAAPTPEATRTLLKETDYATRDTQSAPELEKRHASKVPMRTKLAAEATEESDMTDTEGAAR
jgi:serine/threonine protein kinase